MDTAAINNWHEANQRYLMAAEFWYALDGQARTPKVKAVLESIGQGDDVHTSGGRPGAFHGIFRMVGIHWIDHIGRGLQGIECCASTTTPAANDADANRKVRSRTAGGYIR